MMGLVELKTGLTMLNRCMQGIVGVQPTPQFWMTEKYRAREHPQGNILRGQLT